MGELQDELARVRLVIFDFDGVFTDNAVWIDEDGRELVRCTRADGIGLKKLKALGVATAVLSSEVNPVVRARAAKLQIRCEHSHEDKTKAFADLVAEHGCEMQHVAYVGNDINDLPCLVGAGIPIVVADAHPDVMKYAKLVTQKPGGHGAVREVCDRIAAARARLESSP